MHAPRSRFSPRRKALLVVVVLLLAATLVLRFIGIAGFNGTQPRDMDWNDDGLATRAEIIQGYTVIAVEETREGQRTCRRYARLRDRDDVLRVECRVVFGEDGDDGAPRG